MTGTKITKTFQTRIEDLISESGKTLRDIEKDTGISRAALNNYANDKAEIGINNLAKLSEYFKVSADYLLGLSDAKTNDKELQAICDYTGLDSLAVDKLHRNKEITKYEDVSIASNSIALLEAVTNDFILCPDNTLRFYDQIEKLDKLLNGLDCCVRFLDTVSVLTDLTDFSAYLSKFYKYFQSVRELQQNMLFNAYQIKTAFLSAIDGTLTKKFYVSKAIDDIYKKFIVVEKTLKNFDGWQSDSEVCKEIVKTLSNIEFILDGMDGD